MRNGLIKTSLVMLKTAYPNRRYIGQKVMAPGGKVGRQKGKEIGNELTIIVTIYRI